ncbi:hypothetical protein WICPIJ_001850 [Wickerhamomyces pijperi]|uniref:Peptidase A1 domain-containing protein n=1 Tax=Wickerhamomyces pijperi TaxID=599730 RepID=A0A9P8QCI2_WICPI|nr:hypothetical protein WICPIJ_001850 [Wickerhamomyces pijperi]
MKLNSLILLATATAQLATSSASSHGKFTTSEDSQSIPLINHGDFFGIEVEVGNPAQKVQLLLDTGSDQTWIPSIRGSKCSKNYANKDGKNYQCGSYGTYLERSSTSSNITWDDFSVKYLDGSSAEGKMAYDDLRIGSSGGKGNHRMLLKDAQFGSGRKTHDSMSMGVLGLSLSTFQNSQEGFASFDRENIVHQMKKQGLIQRSIFSVWLNKHQTEAGSILFGAYDLEKFTGTLKTLKMVNTNEKYGSYDPVLNYEVVISNLYLRTPENFNKTLKTTGFDFFEKLESYSNAYISAIFDTGSYYTYFPESIYDVMIEYLEPYIVEKDGAVFLECSESREVSEMFEITLKFGTTVIAVPFDFLIDHVDSTAKIKQNGIDYCKLNVKPLVGMNTDKYNEKIILGQGLLRSMYTVYDLDKFEISVAPARFTKAFNILNVTVQHGLVGEYDGPVDELLLPDVYDQKTDFILNTRENGFMKPLRNDGSSSQFNVGFFSLLGLSLLSTFVYL